MLSERHWRVDIWLSLEEWIIIGQPWYREWFLSRSRGCWLQCVVGSAMPMVTHPVGNLSMPACAVCSRIDQSIGSPRICSSISKQNHKTEIESYLMPTPTLPAVSFREKVGLPCGSAGKESACNAGDLGSIPGLRRSPGEGKGLENSLEKGKATHSSILAWRIAWTVWSIANSWT